MDKFVTSLKRKYRERMINRERQGLLCQSNKLVRLALVEGVKEEGYYAGSTRGKSDKIIKRKPLSLGDLFKVESGERPVKKILVEGDAGIGKTSLSIAVSKDWVNETLFQQFELLLLLPLRHRKVATASTLAELLRLLHSNQKLCNEVAECLEENEGKNILVIADGWDELAESSRSEGSFLYEFLFEDHLPFASVIVTSRPSASIKFHKLSCIDRFVEITGFNNDNITEYIESEFHNDLEKATRLREQLSQNTFVESLCTVPLNCAIVCHLWRTLEEALPTTMTELYTKIICNIILHNIQKNGFDEVMNLPTFDALPDVLKPSWQLLCVLAFQTIERDQLTFTQQELAHLIPAFDDKVLCFGLLQSSQSILEDGCGLSLHFLHLTIQEYLAALHLVKQIPSKDDAAKPTPSITMIKCRSTGIGKKSFMFIPDRFHIVWRFLFGIFFNVVKCSNYHMVQPHLEHTHSKLILCHCALEAKSESIDNHVIELLGKSRLSLQSGSAYDTDAIIHVIDKMNECDKLDIDLEKCNLREDQVRRLADTLASKYGKIKLDYLILAGNDLTETFMYTFLLRASSSLQSLLYLNIRNNRLGADKNCDFFPMQLLFEKVVWLALSDNPLGDPGLLKLQAAIHNGSFKNLSQLDLDNCFMGNAKTNASLLESLLEEIISARCPLKTLTLSRNILGVPGASTLARMISKHSKIMSGQYKWLSELIIDETSLGDAGLCAFIEQLECPHSFSNFGLQRNNLHAAGMICLADAVCSEKINIHGFSRLSLPNMALGFEGTIAIAKILSCKHVYIKELNLSKCQLTEMTEINKTSIIHAGTTEQQLYHLPLPEVRPCTTHFPMRVYLDENNFSGNRIHILADFMYLCPKLAELSTKDCAITSDDLVQLLDKLKQFQLSSNNTTVCSVLSTWNLHKNKIDDKGIIALMQCRLFPQIQGAKIGGCHTNFGILFSVNPVSGEMVKMLDDELRKQFRERKREEFMALKAEVEAQRRKEMKKKTEKKSTSESAPTTEDVRVKSLHASSHPPTHSNDSETAVGEPVSPSAPVKSSAPGKGSESIQPPSNTCSVDSTKDRSPCDSEVTAGEAVTPTASAALPIKSSGDFNVEIISTGIHSEPIQPPSNGVDINDLSDSVYSGKSVGVYYRMPKAYLGKSKKVSSCNIESEGESAADTDSIEGKEASFYITDSGESELLYTETEIEGVTLPLSKSCTETLRSETADNIPTKSLSRQPVDGSETVSDDHTSQSTHDVDAASLQTLADTTVDRPAVPQTLLTRLNQELDFENSGVPLHLGKIADSMYQWEGAVADDHLGLTNVDVEAIKVKHPGELRLQTRAALQTWKRKNGSKATYRELIDVFEQADYQSYADVVRKVLTDGATTKRKHESETQ